MLGRQGIIYKNKKTNDYSHSIVDGGLELMSYTTRLMPLTRLMIFHDISAKES